MGKCQDQTVSPAGHSQSCQAVMQDTLTISTTCYCRYESSLPCLCQEQSACSALLIPNQVNHNSVCCAQNIHQRSNCKAYFFIYILYFCWYLRCIFEQIPVFFHNARLLLLPAWEDFSEAGPDVLGDHGEGRTHHLDDELRRSFPSGSECSRYFGTTLLLESRMKIPGRAV